MSYGIEAIDFGPAHRVVQATVINWANGLEGKPTGVEVAALIQMLAENVTSDRLHQARAPAQPPR